MLAGAAHRHSAQRPCHKQCGNNAHLLSQSSHLLPPSPPSPAPQPNLDSLRKYTYGKHIVNKVEALLAAQAQAEAGAALPSPTAAAEPAEGPPLPIAIAAEQ